MTTSLEQRLKTELDSERARHAEEMRETRKKLKEAQNEILEERKHEAQSQIQVAQTQAIRLVEVNTKTRSDMRSWFCTDSAGMCAADGGSKRRQTEKNFGRSGLLTSGARRKRRKNKDVLPEGEPNKEKQMQHRSE